MTAVLGWRRREFVTLREHLEALRVAEERFREERDRRYAEVNVEKEKALKIKETADLAALQLAREIQTYKDEKANELRSQIERERGTYATQADLRGAVEKVQAQIKPIAEFASAQQGRAGGLNAYVGYVVAAAAVVALVVKLIAG